MMRKKSTVPDEAQVIRLQITEVTALFAFKSESTKHPLMAAFVNDLFVPRAEVAQVPCRSKSNYPKL